MSFGRLLRNLSWFDSADRVRCFKPFSKIGRSIVITSVDVELEKAICAQSDVYDMGSIAVAVVSVGSRDAALVSGKILTPKALVTRD